MAKPCASPDPAEQRKWVTDRRDLQDDVEAEKRALKVAEDQKAELKAAADEADKDAEERRIRKLAEGEHAKLTVEIGADAERLAAKI